METISFSRNRKKTLKLIYIYGAVFVVMLLILLYSTAIISNEIIPKGIVLSSVFMIFIGYFLFKSIIGLNDTTPLISLQPDGIISKVTPMSKAAGLMLWTDIVDLDINDVGSDVLVTIVLLDEQKYAARIKKSLSSLALKDSKNAEGNLLVNLTASEIDIDAQALFNQIQDYRKSVVMNHVNADV